VKHGLTTQEPDAFDSLLRAAVDVSDAPVTNALLLKPLSQDATLGGDRFRICRLIGEGGMGAVYEAEDRHSGARVALKVLNRVEPKRIRRFKDEFRSLADTLHPRLVRLRDLFMEDGVWFFSMDLIEGSTLSAHLATVGPVGSGERERELRRLLSELVEGVAAIHATGHLHRDLKPANVLVAREGGVVIVDFGLVGDVASPATAGGVLPVIGTASHMSPEQARGEPATTASDWYAVGTIAYEALTGRAPIEGDSTALLHHKRRAAMPSLFTDGRRWPEDLVELCRGLLDPEPTKRLDHAGILHCLGTSPVSRPIAGAEPAFVGRFRELAALSEALDRAESGALVVCRVTGAPGIGKTALVREFLRRAARDRNAVVLSGRCYEREATPFKLLEGLVDGLSEAIERCVPRARDIITPLASLFLGLASRAHYGERRATADARTKAVHAFRAGLAELSTVGSVILHVDDVQWCDADGVELLDEVLEAPALPSLLILARRDEEGSEPVRALWRAKFLEHAAVIDLHIDGLSSSDFAALVQAMAGRERELDIDAIARESGGSPYFAAEMIRHALEQRRAGNPIEKGAAITLGHAILARYRNLPSAAREILEALSVCDGPRSLPLLRAATGVDDAERAIAVLRSATFVRTRRLRDEDTPSVEPYHDRVREEIQRVLSEADRRALHLGLARAFEEHAPNACEPMLHHFEGAGDFAKASVYAVRSAERAAEAQAFVQAAALYERALWLGRWEAGDEQKLHESLGRALALCGHNAEAAEALERAASMAPTADRVRLQMLGAGTLLCAGNFRTGVQRLTESLEYLGVQIPEESAQASLMLEYTQQALLEASGLVHRDEASVDPDQLLRIDACWWVAAGLTVVHHPAAAFFTSFHLLEAVRAREPTRIARGAYAQAIYTAATLWDATVPIVRGLMQIGDDAAARSPDAQMSFWRDYSLAAQHYFAFDVDRAIAHVEAAYAHASKVGEGLENATSRLVLLEITSRIHRSPIPADFDRCEVLKRNALRRRDQSVTAWVRILDHQSWLKDQPELLRADMNALLSELTHTGGDDAMLVCAIEVALARVERYTGQTADSFARIERALAPLRGSLHWMIPLHRANVGTEFVASAIAHAEASNSALPPDAEAVLSELPVQSCGVAGVLRAAIANLAGDRDEAIRLLERAESEPGMDRKGHVIGAARFARGRLLGGSAGRALVREELEKWRRVGFVNPERLLEHHWPGFRCEGSTR
jgi:eukaryotic-like serine/threonine-protein kinase